MRTRLSLFASALILGAALHAAPAAATVVVMHSLEEMTQRSDVIVHARVAAQRVERKEQLGIITLTDIEVIDGIKGAKPGDVLTIYQVGGSLDGEHAWIAGAHKHRIGEEMVFFAVRHGTQIVSYGVGLGKFLVEHDGKVPGVREDIGDIAVMERGPDGELRYTSPEPRTAPSLDAFKERIRRADKAPLEKPTDKLQEKAPMTKTPALWQGTLRKKEGR
jgi:hypothetical protein